MRHLRRFAVLAVLGLGLLGTPARAADPADADFARVNATLVTGYILPQVRDLAGATARLATDMRGFCRAPAADRFAPVASRFNTALDRWMRVRSLVFGPLELFMRVNRFQFAPDPTQRVEKDIAAFLAAGDEKELAPERFPRSVVSIQGFSALEQLLFGKAAHRALLRGDGEAAFRCRFATAISRNLAEMAQGMVMDWQGGGGEKSFVDIMTRPGPDNGYFRTHTDVTMQLFKSLYVGLHTIVDVQLGPPLGGSLDNARPELVENGPSGRSLASIVAALESSSVLYFGPRGDDGLESLLVARGTDKPLVPLLRRAYAMTLETARGIDVPLARAVVDPAWRSRAQKLHLQVRALKQLIGHRLGEALGLAVGFNALDGD